MHVSFHPAGYGATVGPSPVLRVFISPARCVLPYQYHSIHPLMYITILSTTPQKTLFMLKGASHQHTRTQQQ